MNIIAQTPSFVIRNFTPEEEATYLSLFEDEDVIEHLPKRSLKENIAIFHTTLIDYTEGKALGRWGIFNNGDNDFIGICLLRTYNYEPGKVELGYVLNKKFWGKGIASEMARIMVAYGFTHTGAHEIVAVTSLGNTGSQKVLEKAGLKRMPNFKRDGEELAYFRVEKLAWS
ncbi:ribosomal-protein-alanine N-acetyltransferase [Mucilaginibacter frigoritolerans]|jgi:[ribosomal protein S5]-alanine N-acetyltransferase|uniref:Ribosomal-protein-alanine N-acetyltransferase n=1 Tax=Mucilaginibacter frigoritolerans TaxID=652788 RepID=A0A562U0Y7_9SPHI|nr:GNAT family N-acetyltransferase [Mucilaginibacter frigoritolerans]TWI98750.1 ribosomal-protein-alanine N-acetyltransferase [Mucilaginibacter frigoritolerans]